MALQCTDNLFYERLAVGAIKILLKSTNRTVTKEENVHATRYFFKDFPPASRCVHDTKPTLPSLKNSSPLVSILKNRDGKPENKSGKRVRFEAPKSLQKSPPNDSDEFYDALAASVIRLVAAWTLPEVHPCRGEAERLRTRQRRGMWKGFSTFAYLSSY